jgi:zinc transporter 2
MSASRSELHRRSVRSHTGSQAASHHSTSHGGSHDSSGHEAHHHGHSHNGQPCHGHGHGHSHGAHGHSVGTEEAHHDHGHSHHHHAHTHSHGDGGCCGGDHHDHGHSHGNMNIRGAAMHALGDCMQSVGVMIASGVIWVGAGAVPHATSWYNLADPLASVFFAALTLWATKGLFVDVLAILMERAPKSVSIPSLRARLGRLPHVIDVGDVHVWSITSERKAIAAHVLVKEGATSAEVEQLLVAGQMLCRRMGFVVATIQVDYVNLVFGHLLPQQVVALRAPPPLIEPQPQFMLQQQLSHEQHEHPPQQQQPAGVVAVTIHSLRSQGSHHNDA